MVYIPVAVDYIELHRKDSSDEEIARALKEQGFSDEMLAEAFRIAGARPAAEPAARLPPGRSALVAALFAVSALLLAGSAALFVRNFRRAERAAEAGRPG